MVSLVKYSKTDFTKISLELPKKIDGVYTSDITYDKSQFMIQTPILDFNKKENSEEIIVKTNCQEFISFFDSLSVNLLELLHTNSKEFFNGKEFSMERLASSLEDFVQLADIDETIENGEKGPQEVNNVSFSKDIKITNIFNEIILPIYPIRGKCVLHLKNITFHGKQFKSNIEVKVIKIEHKRKVNRSVLLNLDETESEEEKVESESEKEIIESETEKVEVKIDSLDFFD